jgi:hypothetical protein
LLYIAATDDILMISSQYSEYFTGPGYYDMGDTSIAFVELNITDITQSPTISAVYYFLFS